MQRYCGNYYLAKNFGKIISKKVISVEYIQYNDL